MPPTRPRRVRGYARVSSEEQARGTSLADQQDAIKREAAARGAAASDVVLYVEAESAVYERIERRDEMRRLLADVKAGDLVLCDKLDRWSRDPEFTYRTMRELKAAGASVFFVAERCDPFTPEGDTMLTWRAAMAREEHKRIRERMVGTRKRLRDRGLYAEGLPPIGYKRPEKAATPLDRNVLAVHEEGAARVRDIFARCLRGESIGRIVLALGLEKKQVNAILRNRLYLGEVKNADGEWIKGQHAAIIAPDVFARAQVALDGRRLGGARASADSATGTWLLREIGVCARCEARISAAYGAGTKRSGGSYTYYYRCPRTCPGYIRVEPADLAAAAMTLGRLAELRDLLAIRTTRTSRPPAPDSTALRARLQKRRERYLDVFAEGDMTKDELRAALAKVDAERLAIDARESATQARPLEDAKRRRALLADLERLQNHWGNASPAIRRQIIGKLAHSVALAKGVAPVPSWKTPEELSNGNL